MRFFMFPILVTLVLSGCDKQQQEEAKTPVTAPPVSMSTPPPSPEAPVVVAPQAVVPQEAPPLAAPVAVPPVPAPPVSKAPAPKAPVKATPEKASEPVIASAKSDALALAKQSGCLACHNVDKKIVGPAWKDVSVRYKNDAEARARLIAKVKAGGKGNWTEVTGGMAMPPYSPRVSDHDIETLVDFVLSLAR